MLLQSRLVQGLIRRRFSSAASSSKFSTPQTQVTKLSNGIRVASENLDMETATVGVWINTGSRFENARNNGTAHFLEHMAFKGTEKRSQRDLELEIENMGGHLNAYTSREQTAYYAKVLKRDIPVAVEILSDILQNAKYQESAIEAERSVIIREHEEVSKQNEEVIFDHLHAAAFQGNSLGRTILGPVENIRRISRKDLVDFVKDQYVGPKVVVAAAGGVNHEELVTITERLFAKIPSNSPSHDPSEPPVQRALYTGSEVRMRDDEMPNAHMAIAVEGASWTSPDYFPLLIAQTIIGSWDRSMSGGANMSSEFAQVVSKYNLAHSFTSFNTSYSDTGLFGVYMVSDRRYALDDLVYELQQNWVRLCLHTTEEQVERSKLQLKSNFLLQLDGTTQICEDIGRQLLCYGKRLHLNEIFSQIDAVDAKRVREVTSRYLYDRCPAIAAFGPIESMTEYGRIRHSMMWLRN